MKAAARALRSSRPATSIASRVSAGMVARSLQQAVADSDEGAELVVDVRHDPAGRVGGRGDLAVGGELNDVFLDCR